MSDEPQKVIQPTIFPTPFAPAKCNKTWVIPYSCASCGGLQTPLIKDWVSCIMEPVAVWLKMLKFDFYNDWVSGSLYFPLIKRKRKIRKRRKKLGQLKKDKFCDFDCDTFQGVQTYLVNRIRLKTPIFTNPEVEIAGCKTKIRGKITTNWYGAIGNTTTENLDTAATELVLPGTNNNGEGCQITFDNYAAVVSAFQPFSQVQVNGTPQKQWEKEVQTEHGKPEYIETIDPLTGNETFVNIGGHGHHKNKCNRTRMMERGEYYKDSLDCWTKWDEPDVVEVTSLQPPDISDTVEETINIAQDASTACLDCIGPFDEECCKPDCGTNGVAGCTAFCTCSDQESRNYEQVMEHGYVKTSDHDNALYYASIITSDDIAFNDREYKANLIMPIGVTELGSSTYCDIDDAPFIMDELSPTTFQVSMEKLKFRWGADVQNFTDTTVTPPVTYDWASTVNKVEDKDGTLNLRAYVEFSCVATVCLNTLATVQQSQIGTEIIDSNDLGVEIGNCFTRFINDPDIRGYFCRRFSGYKDTQLNVHYMRPGSTQYENDYQIYPEIILTEGYKLAYILEGGSAIIGSEYNDEDEFVPGDACGFYKPNNSVSPDYFYGAAQGQTSGFDPFPNTTNLSTSNFGNSAHLPSNLSYPYTVDVINDMTGGEDDNNGNSAIKGIKFNRSQTPYHLYFGLVPGKTSLHKTVAKFFADKIDKVTLEGIGEKDPGPDVHNQNNITNTVKNPYSIYRTCLGQTQLPAATSSGFVPTGGLSSQGLGCEMVITVLISQETYLNGNDGSMSVTPTLGIGPFTYDWNNGDDHTNYNEFISWHLFGNCYRLYRVSSITWRISHNPINSYQPS